MWNGVFVSRVLTIGTPKPFRLAHLGIPTHPHIGHGEPPALTESRYQAEHQQLAEMRGRSVRQRLKAVLAANP